VDRAGRPCRGRVDAGRRLVRRLQDGGHRLKLLISHFNAFTNNKNHN
jgi:hypothetical protein